MTSVVLTSPSLIRQTSEGAKLHVPYGEYVIRPSSEVRPLLQALVEEVSSLLGTSPDESTLLLKHCSWSRERLMDRFFADAEALRTAAGLDLFSKLSPRPSVGVASSAASSAACEPCEPCVSSTPSDPCTFTCTVCYDCDVPLSQSAALGCGHRFCETCYTGYLTAQVSEGPACVLARCMAPSCSQRVPPSFFAAFLPEEAASRYERFLLRDFVSKNSTIRFCPAAGCDNVAVGSAVTKIACPCGNFYCFRCGEDAHDPCSCDMLAKWNEKNLSDSENANWINANTQACPKCRTRIEKNQGCNHMTCKVCKHHFCWICSGDWMKHGGDYYKCNRFDPNSEEAKQKSKAKVELDRYLHFYNRFKNHDQALKFAADARDKITQKMHELESRGASQMDVEYLKDAMEQVIACRRVLKFTYAMGFFFEDNTPGKFLFENHQEMLEKNTEKLSEYTELPMEQVDRTQVIDLTRATKKFLESMLENATVADTEQQIPTHTHTHEQGEDDFLSKKAKTGAEWATPTKEDFICEADEDEVEYDYGDEEEEEEAQDDNEEEYQEE